MASSVEMVFSHVRPIEIKERPDQSAIRESSFLRFERLGFLPKNPVFDIGPVFSGIPWVSFRVGRFKLDFRSEDDNRWFLPSSWLPRRPSCSEFDFLPDPNCRVGEKQRETATIKIESPNATKVVGESSQLCSTWIPYAKHCIGKKEDENTRTRNRGCFSLRCRSRSKRLIRP